MGILYILLGAAFGAIITYLQLQNTPHVNNEELQKLKRKDHSLDLRIKSGEERHQRLEEELKLTKEICDQGERELLKLDTEIIAVKAQLESVEERNSNDLISQQETPIVNRNDETTRLEKQLKALLIEKSELEIEKTSLEKEIVQVNRRMEKVVKDLKKRIIICDELNHALSKEKEDHQALKEKHNIQSTAIQSLGKKFNSDFQSIASKILEELESRQKTEQ